MDADAGADIRRSAVVAVLLLIGIAEVQAVALLPQTDDAGFDFIVFAGDIAEPAPVPGRLPFDRTQIVRGEGATGLAGRLVGDANRVGIGVTRPPVTRAVNGNVRRHARSHDVGPLHR